MLSGTIHQRYRVFSVTREPCGDVCLSDSPVWHLGIQSALDELQLTTTRDHEQLRIEAEAIHDSTDAIVPDGTAFDQLTFDPVSESSLYDDDDSLLDGLLLPSLEYRTIHIISTQVQQGEPPISLLVDSPFWRDRIEMCSDEMARGNEIGGHCLTTKIEVRQVISRCDSALDSTLDSTMSLDVDIESETFVDIEERTEQEVSLTSACGVTSPVETMLQKEYCITFAAYVIKTLPTLIPLQCWGCSHKLPCLKGHDLCTMSVNDQVSNCWGTLIDNIISLKKERSDFFTNLIESFAVLDPTPPRHAYEKFLTLEYLCSISRDLRQSIMDYINAYLSM